MVTKTAVGIQPPPAMLEKAIELFEDFLLAAEIQQTKESLEAATMFLNNAKKSDNNINVERYTQRTKALREKLKKLEKPKHTPNLDSYEGEPYQEYALETDLTNWRYEKEVDEDDIPESIELIFTFNRSETLVKVPGQGGRTQTDDFPTNAKGVDNPDLRGDTIHIFEATADNAAAVRKSLRHELQHIAQSWLGRTKIEPGALAGGPSGYVNRDERKRQMGLPLTPHGRPEVGRDHDLIDFEFDPVLTDTVESMLASLKADTTVRSMLRNSTDLEGDLAALASGAVKTLLDEPVVQGWKHDEATWREAVKELYTGLLSGLEEWAPTVQTSKRTTIPRTRVAMPMRTPSEMPKGWRVVFRKKHSGAVLFSIQDADNFDIVGEIEVKPNDENRWSVVLVQADYGWGPLLYEVAMEWVTKQGGTLTSDDEVSPDAVNVWKKFMQRKDVEREQLSGDKKVKTYDGKWFHNKEPALYHHYRKPNMDRLKELSDAGKLYKLDSSQPASKQKPSRVRLKASSTTLQTPLERQTKETDDTYVKVTSLSQLFEQSETREGFEGEKIASRSGVQIPTSYRGLDVRVLSDYEGTAEGWYASWFLGTDLRPIIAVDTKVSEALAQGRLDAQELDFTLSHEYEEACQTLAEARRVGITDSQLRKHCVGQRLDHQNNIAAKFEEIGGRVHDLLASQYDADNGRHAFDKRTDKAFALAYPKKADYVSLDETPAHFDSPGQEWLVTDGIDDQEGGPYLDGTESINLDYGHPSELVEGIEDGASATEYSGMDRRAAVEAPEGMVFDVSVEIAPEENRYKKWNGRWPGPGLYMRFKLVRDGSEVAHVILETGEGKDHVEGPDSRAPRERSAIVVGSRAHIPKQGYGRMVYRYMLERMSELGVWVSSDPGSVSPNAASVWHEVHKDPTMSRRIHRTVGPWVNAREIDEPWGRGNAPQLFYEYRKAVKLPEKMPRVPELAKNLPRIYELEYKYSQLAEARKKGPLPDRAEKTLALFGQELERLLDEELARLRKGIARWLSVVKQMIDEDGWDSEEAQLFPTVQQALRETVNPKTLGEKSAFMNRLLNVAHASGTMADWAYVDSSQFGSKVDEFRERDQVQRVLDFLSDIDTTPWDAELKSLLALPRGAAASGPSKKEQKALEAVRSKFSDDLLHPKYRKLRPQDAPASWGHCYAATEALYYLLGGKDAGYKQKCIRAVDWPEGEGTTHWYLESPSGAVLDPTADQFGDKQIPYHLGRGVGFQGRPGEPSARAKKMLAHVAEVHKEALYAEDSWVAPDGSEHILGDARYHSTWAFQHMEQQGIAVRDHISALRKLLEQGWLRVSRPKSGGGGDIEVFDWDTINGDLVKRVARSLLSEGFPCVYIDTLDGKGIQVTKNMRGRPNWQTLDEKIRKSVRAASRDNFWVDPAGREYPITPHKSHDAWAYNIKKSTATQLLNQGWIRVAPPDSIELNEVSTENIAVVESVARQLLQAVDTVWIDTETDGVQVGRVHGRLDLSALYRLVQGVSLDGEMTHNLSTLTTPPPNETPLDSTSSGSEEQLVKMGRFLRIRRS